MKNTKFYFPLIIIIATLFSCSEIKDEITMPETVSIHGKESMILTANGFHGRQLVDGKMESCKQCHASDYSGGTALVSCSSGNCHPAINVHTQNIMNTSSHEFHGKYIANTNWNMSLCKQCHGASYSGGIVSPTCNNCHNNAGGPEACNTCHGDFLNPQRISPPRSINKGLTTDVPGVGAHIVHLTDVKIGQNVRCMECHNIPSYFDSPGHIDNTPRAEVIFASFSSSGVGTPSYNLSTYKCNNTYCHGSFEFHKSNSQYPFAYVEDKMVGNNYNPVWNKVDGTEAACGTCHGLPPTGHMSSQLRSCATCHQGVVNDRGVIIDPTKHINGKIDVFGN